MASDKGSPKIYTRTGDKGKTSLIGGTRVLKSDLRLETYGTVDELNSIIGVLISQIETEISPASELTPLLRSIQNDLFDIGSHLACESAEFRAQMPALSQEKITGLEAEMDRLSAHLQPLRNFILPGGSLVSGFAHMARTVCRRAERATIALQNTDESSVDLILIQYLNRLSDYFFVLARYLNFLLKKPEPIWSPKAKSQTPDSNS